MNCTTPDCLATTRTTRTVATGLGAERIVMPLCDEHAAELDAEGTAMNLAIASITAPIEIVSETDGTHGVRLLLTGETRVTIEVAGTRHILGWGLLRAATRQDTTLAEPYRAILRAAETDIRLRRAEAARAHLAAMTPAERQRSVVRSLRREADAFDAAGRHVLAEQARRTAEEVRVID